MSTPQKRKGTLTLPPWLTVRTAAAMSQRTDGRGRSITDRVMVGLTIPERAGLDRITEAGKRAGYPLSDVDVVRTALDRLIADFEAAQVDPHEPPAAGTQEPQS